MKICFLAPSGYGKSTAIEILKKHYDIKNIKIAEPLYELQNNFYDMLGIDVSNRQDGELLQFYGEKIRYINKTYLIDKFKERLDKSVANIITNDDCRPKDYKYLKDMGFIFIKINGFRRDRNDITIADSYKSIEWHNDIPYDYEIDNYSSILEFENNLVKLINRITSPKCYIIPTQNRCNANCVFCISKTRKYNKFDEFLEVNDKFIENIYMLKKHGITRFEITGGGEPFLNEKLFELILTIKRIIPDSYIKLYTNGNILGKVNGIDELDISVVSDNLNINNKFMNGNNIELLNKLKFFKSENIKLRLSIPIIKGGVDNKNKLDDIINNTQHYVDEYVVRTLYPGTKNIDELYIDFPYVRDKVIFERDNDVKEFNDIILWSDNCFYSSWNLDSKKYFFSYILLKPDSKKYINEIDNLIKLRGFEIVDILFIKDFKNKIINLYNEKNKDYLELIERHLYNLSLLFGDNALVYILDKNKTLNELYFDTLKLKDEIRNKYSFTHAHDGYILNNENISHLNMVHCPDIDIGIYNRDLNYLMNNNFGVLNNKQLKLLKKYRSYEL